MKTPNNIAAEQVDRLTVQNAELLNLKTQTEIGNQEYCARLDAEMAANVSIIDMLTPAAEWTESNDPTA